MGLASDGVPGLAELELLDAVVRHGSMTAAASVVGMTQQAVSLRIRAMERSLGVPLVARSSHGSQLTPAGSLLHEWSAILLAEARELAIGVASLRTDRQSRLRIASSLTIAEHLLPRWLVEFADQQHGRSRPGTDVELTAINTDSVAARVRGGLADVGFVEGPTEPRGLHAMTVAHDELLIVVGPGHAWARRRRPVTAVQLAATPMVGREPGSGSRHAFETALAAALPDGVTPAVPALEVSTAAAVRAAVAAGAGPAAISSYAVADDLTLGRIRVVPVTGLDLHRTLRGVWRGDPRPPAGPVRDLLAIAVGTDRELGRQDPARGRR